MTQLVNNKSLANQHPSLLMCNFKTPRWPLWKHSASSTISKTIWCFFLNICSSNFYISFLAVTQISSWVMPLWGSGLPLSTWQESAVSYSSVWVAVSSFLVADRLDNCALIRDFWAPLPVKYSRFVFLCLVIKSVIKQALWRNLISVFHFINEADCV